MTEPLRDSAILTAALRYAARGWPVFPCSPENKRPLVPTAAETRAGFYVDVDGHRHDVVKGEGGLKLATCDARQIRAWWTRWPNAMIGMPTGETVGVVVVDLDPRDLAADTMLKALAKFCGPAALPPAPLVRTQSGGLHLWFAYPAMPDGEKLGNRAGLFAKVDAAVPGLDEAIREHVDIRAEGGYVILPPSRMASGNVYDWEQTPFELGDDPFPAMPQRLFDVIAKCGEFAPKGKAAAGAGDRRAPSRPVNADERVRKYGLNALVMECAELARTPEGRRHNALNIAAFNLGTLVGAGALSETTARSEIEAAAQWPGSVWTKKEADTLDDGMRAGMAHPRDLSAIASTRYSRPPDREAREARPLSSSTLGAASSSSSAPPPPTGEKSAENPLDASPETDEPHHDESLEGGPQSGEGSGGDGDGGFRGTDLGDGGDDGKDERIAACLWLALNDTGNAERLLRHFGANILHVREVGWHRWTGTHWEIEGGDEYVARCAQMVAELIADEAVIMERTQGEKLAIAAGKLAEAKAPDDRTDDDMDAIYAGREALEALAKRKSSRRKFAVSCGNTTKIKGMILQALPHRTVAPEDLDRDPMKFNVMNGTLHFIREAEPDEEATSDETRYRARIEIRPHRREDLITKLAPATYDGRAAAPRWQAFLDRFQKDASVRRFLQVYSGYALTGLTDEQVLIYNYGRGANGKSTFAEALLQIYGEYARTLNPESVSGDGQRRGDQATPEIAQLPGSRLVIVSELAAGAAIKENLIKALTGGERMQARHLHKGFFDFYPSFKAMMSGNDMPTIYGTDLGIWRRMKIVPWTETIADAERRKLAEVLAEFEAERSGILNWLLEGLQAYLTEGLVVPEPVSALTASYRDEVDRLGSFMRDCVTVTGNADDMVQAKPFYEAFVAWCEAAAKKPLTMTAFGREMTSHGMKKEARAGRLFYIGVTLHDVPARAQGDFGAPPDAAYADELHSRPGPEAG